MVEQAGLEQTSHLQHILLSNIYACSNLICNTLFKQPIIRVLKIEFIT